MQEDPVVAETRALRAEMMEEAGSSLDGLFEILKKEQQHHRERLVRLPPRKALRKIAKNSRAKARGTR
jgi:hypothetical protein